MRFRLKCDCTFEAYDLHEAAHCLTNHFVNLMGMLENEDVEDGENLPELLGELHLGPVEKPAPE